VTRARIGGPVDETHVTLAIHGPDLDPAEITSRLGVEPTRAHARGDARRRGPPWTRGRWSLVCQGRSPTGADDLIRELLGLLPPLDALVWDELRKRCELKVWIGCFLESDNRGFVLRPSSVRALARLGAELNVDIYAG